MNHWGITGWKPNWINAPDELLAQLITNFPIGKTISRTISLRDEEGWFSDAPVIISIDGVNHEFCATKIGEYSYTRNSIDISVPVNWCEEPNGKGSLHWQESAIPEMQLFEGKVVDKVGVVEHLLDESIQEIFQQSWVLAGVYFVSNDQHLEIYNALDCNGVVNAKKSISGLRYRSSA